MFKMPGVTSDRSAFSSLLQKGVLFRVNACVLHMNGSQACELLPIQDVS